jgi:hypothetical protein
MNRVKQLGGIAVALLLVIVAGCGGSAASPVGTSGTISGTVTREVTLTNAPEIEDTTIRLPEADTEVEIYQGATLRQKSRTDAQGRFTVSVPVGRYLVKPSDAILERTPAVIGSQEVTVSADKTALVELEIIIPSL